MEEIKRPRGRPRKTPINQQSEEKQEDLEQPSNFDESDS